MMSCTCVRALAANVACSHCTCAGFSLTPHGRALVDENGVWVTPTGEYSVQCEAGGEAKTPAVTLAVPS